MTDLRQVSCVAIDVNERTCIPLQSFIHGYLMVALLFSYLYNGSMVKRGGHQPFPFLGLRLRLSDTDERLVIKVIKHKIEK